MTTSDQIEVLSEFVSEHKKRKVEDVLDSRTNKITLVLEDLFHAQNTSAVIRTCECFGIQNLHIIEDRNPMQTSIRVAQGSSKWVKLHNHVAEGNVSPIAECVNNLKSQGYQIVVTDLSEGSVPIDDLDYHDKMAFAFGTEITGISDELKNMADQKIHIPMYGFTDSFNISVSAALCLQHVLPQYKEQFPNWRLHSDEKEELRLQWYKSIVRRSDLILERNL